MGREIRRVPANWEHPKTKLGNEYQPMHDTPYSKAIGEWIKNHLLWECGKHPDQLNGSFGKGCRYYAEWAGNPPDVEYYRPDWKPEDMTWYQVYETVSEGTPVSPPFATREELVDYLMNHGDFWDQKRGAKPWSRKSAESFVMGSGWAPSIVITPGHGVQTGIEALNYIDLPKEE